ncbi:hypothetical protein SAMN06265365_10723 [Tistlia consotensis]|uniref:Tetratricopeptide repeat-containing protein n=1 Tax=Tistlia consotensis USBA 355 TaxID=560819 RepID=A0A1Y6BBV1_9PROT|nr:hypothetical protein [Tistlia consotensis]SME96819.1 hypothetical protein SAMN05428998_10223 [Tistlia consotensis USBA 355]SNR56188.1 hypothetical protein SAMN06265365_10723 [Tistlia consotensis]
MALSAPSRALALALSVLMPLTACTSAGGPQASSTAPAPQAAQPAAAKADGKETPAEQLAQGYDYPDAEAQVRVGGEALQRGDLTEARGRFEFAIREWPVLKSAWQGLAETAERQGDQDTADRARFFLARIGWIDQVHPLAAASAFRNLSEGKTTDQDVATPAYREQAARIVDFLDAADLANVEAANRAEPGENFVQRYGIYVAGIVGVVLVVSRFNTVLFGSSDSSSN